MSQNWNNDTLQFARFMTEANMAGALTQQVMTDMAKSMDLSTKEVQSLITRAETMFHTAIDDHYCECGADLSKNSSVKRDYVNKDGSAGCFGFGHYYGPPLNGQYECDTSPDLSIGRWDLLDNSDTCAGCGAEL